jgi:hypothetical protein
MPGDSTQAVVFVVLPNPRGLAAERLALPFEMRVVMKPQQAAGIR